MSLRELDGFAPGSDDGAHPALAMNSAVAAWFDTDHNNI